MTFSVVGGAAGVRRPFLPASSEPVQARGAAASLLRVAHQTGSLEAR